MRIGHLEGIGSALVLAGVVAAWIVERRRRRRAEAVAREHDAQRAIVSEAPVMIWRSGVDKGCDFFNPCAGSLIGMKMREPFVTTVDRSAEYCVEICVSSKVTS